MCIVKQNKESRIALKFLIWVILIVSLSNKEYMEKETQHLWGFMGNETATLKCSVDSMRLKEEIYESTAYKIIEVDSI